MPRSSPALASPSVRAEVDRQLPWGSAAAYRARTDEVAARGYSELRFA
jgi:hypothetical protein